MATQTIPAEFESQLPRTLAAFEQGRAKGLHHGAQVCVFHRGALIVDAGLGDALPGTPMTPDHITHWLSAGKPLTAMLIGQLVAAHRLTWDTLVADVIPEFGVGGKERISLRHILTHTAGLRNVDFGGPETTWDETIARICVSPPDEGAVPGATAGYHVASTWFVLGEVVQRITGRSFADVLQEAICEPAGMEHTRASLVEHASSENDLATRDIHPAIAPLFERAAGPLQMLDWHVPPRSERVSPGSSLRGPIRDLARFYEAVRKGLLLPPDTLEEMTTRQRVGLFDQTLGHVVDFGFGFIINSQQYGDSVPYGYGRFASSGTFGHGGAQSSQGFCDPEKELTVAWLFNGRPGEGQHQRRLRAFNEAIYRDLGLD